MPDAETVQTFYSQYTTHQPAAPSRKSAKPRTHPDDSTLLEILRMPSFPNLRCLDYGCGNGKFLMLLRTRSVGPLVGYEPDSAAAEVARLQGLEVHENESLAMAEGPFDLITLNHVLEHLPQPLATLKSLAKVLKPGGALVLRTPNAASMLAACFGDNWRGWETPRHLNLFSPGSLGRLAEQLGADDLRVVRLVSPDLMFKDIYHSSFHGALWRESLAGKLARHALFPWVSGACRVARWTRPLSGEELLVVIQKRDR